MFKHDQEQVIDLISSLIRTNSPKSKYDLLVDFCLNCPAELTEFDETTRLNLINEIKTIRDRSSNQGKKYAAIKEKAINNKIYKHPGFFEAMPNVFCNTCNRHLENSPGFNWKKNKDDWFSYCPTLLCFPKDQTIFMKNNYQYNLWLNSKNINAIKVQ